LQKILAMNLQDFQKLPGFGDRKADIVYGSIKRSTVDVPLHIYMHASGYFGGLGSKKIIKVLEAIQKLNGDHHITFDEVKAIEGFAEKSARMYWDGVQKFKPFALTVPVTFKMPDFSVNANSGFSGNTYVFTGFRDNVIQQRIEKLGGKVSSAVSGKTTHLVMKDPEEKLTKYQAAVKVNATIMTYDELMKQLDEVKD
jgi:NAD-dependent DNA ligase